MSDNWPIDLLLDSSRINNHHYSLIELAKHWNCEESDIIHLAISGELWLSVYIAGLTTPFSLAPMGWVHLADPEEISSILLDRDEFHFTSFFPPGRANRDYTPLIFKNNGEPFYFAFSRKDIVALNKEVARYQLTHPFIIQKNKRFTQENPAMNSSDITMEPSSPLKSPVEAPQEVSRIFDVKNTPPMEDENVSLPPDNKRFLEDKVFEGRKKIEEAFNFYHEGRNVKYDTIYRVYFLQQGLKITYQPKPKKQIPRLLLSDILQFLNQ